MKRKFINALLFGALIAASTSTFVSCSKDYDGDITELRTKVTTNATDLTSLVEEKIKNVSSEINALKAQQTSLDEAYKAADQALADAIASATNDANGYAEIQAAEAQRAAIAAAQEMVNSAVEQLEASLNEAKQTLEALGQTVTSQGTIIDEQGKTLKEQAKTLEQLTKDSETQAEALAKQQTLIDGLLEADQTLNTAIVAAQSRADAAYTLAEQAKALAEAAQATADQNKTDIANLTQKLTDATTELSKVSESLTTLESKLGTLDGQVQEVLEKANDNKTKIEALTTQLNDLKGSNETALKQLSDKDDELQKLIDDNQSKISKALEDEAKLREKADKNLQDAIDATNLVCQGLQTQIDGINTTIDDVKKSVSDLDTKLSKDISDLKDDLTQSLKEQQETLQAAIDAKADAATVEALTRRVEALENAIKNFTSANFDDLKSSVSTNSDNIGKLQNSVIEINNKLANLFQNLNNLITGVIVQDASHIQMLYAQVLRSDLDKTNASGLTILDNGKVYFPYKGATGAATLTAGKYNVEKNIGLLYFTLNPNTVDFGDKANVNLENSLGTAPADISLGTVENATDHLITRAASQNGLYQVRLTNDKPVMNNAPEYANSYALYSKYNTTDAEGKTKESRVYSKYEVNIKGTKATNDVEPTLKATGENYAPLSNDGGWLFSAVNGGNLTGALELGTTGADKAYAKYVEVYEVYKPSNDKVTAPAELKDAKDDFKKYSTGIETVLYEPQDGETGNLFNGITVGVSDKYNGYTFTLRYFVQQYNGVVRMVKKNVRFSKPMFASEDITIEVTPTASGLNDGAVSGDALAKLAYMRGSGSNYSTWKANTKYIAVEDGDAEISAVKFGYGTSGSSESVSKDGKEDISTTILSAGNGKVTNVAVAYDPSNFELGKTYSFNIVSKDANENIVTTTKVNIKMLRPTVADAELIPNPAFAPAGTLTAWAKYDGTNAAYDISNAFNKPIYVDGTWGLRLDDAGTYNTTATQAYAPISTFPLVSIAADQPLKMEVPVAALLVTDGNGKVTNDEHVYTLHYGPQYYGLANLWSNNYNGYGFENGGAKFNGAHKFDIVFKSPIYYAAKAASFKASEYAVDYPGKSMTIENSEISSDDPSTSEVDAVNFLGANDKISGKDVVLEETKYSSLFKSYTITDGKIKIETAEGTIGAGAIDQKVKFSLKVTDKFGNVAKIPFTVIVKANTNKQ